MPPLGKTAALPSGSSTDQDECEHHATCELAMRSGLERAKLRSDPAARLHPDKGLESTAHERQKQPMLPASGTLASSHGTKPSANSQQGERTDGHDCTSDTDPGAFQPEHGSEPAIWQAPPQQQGTVACTRDRRPEVVKGTRACQQPRSDSQEVGQPDYDKRRSVQRVLEEECACVEEFRGVLMNRVAVIGGGSQCGSSRISGRPDDNTTPVDYISCDLQLLGSSVGLCTSTADAESRVSNGGQATNMPAQERVDRGGLMETPVLQGQADGDAAQAMEALSLERADRPGGAQGQPAATASHPLQGQCKDRVCFPGFPAPEILPDLTRLQSRSNGTSSMRIASLDGWLPTVKPRVRGGSRLHPIADSMLLPGSNTSHQVEHSTTAQCWMKGRSIELEDEGLQDLLKQEQMLGLQSAPEDAGVQQCWERIIKFSSLLEFPEPMSS